MDRLPPNRSDWPTKGYIHQAINILERIHKAKGHVSTIPMDCRPGSWRFPQLIYDLINQWTADEDCRIAFLGFPQSPATIMLGWMLERTRMGRRELTSLEVEENEFPDIIRACGHLARCKILVQSAGFADVGSFYAQVQRVAAEFGVSRVLAHDCLLRSGTRLSESPIPNGWQDVCDFLDVEVVMVGRQGVGDREKSEASGASSRGTVLVVDDVDSVRDCLSIIMEHWGFTVLKAGSSEEALRLAGGVCVDLMISDINRPGMNGLDFLPVFRQLHPNTPVIFISSCLFDDVLTRASRLGVAGLLNKPFKLDDLRDVLRQVGLAIDPAK